jgi:hypothetical protein
LDDQVVNGIFKHESDVDSALEEIQRFMQGILNPGERSACMGLTMTTDKH